MDRVFKFMDEEPITFDDTRSVKELIRYAFDRFDYHEPAGMDIVTVFQPHARTDTGWFTTDTSRSCKEEIENAEGLCFAYHMPNAFYFAEGGWGRHMPQLGNHPKIADPVILHLRFDEFDNAVVINGKYTFRQIVRFLKKTGYLDDGASSLQVCAFNPYQEPYSISFHSESMRLPLTEFEKTLPDSVVYLNIH